LLPTTVIDPTTELPITVIDTTTELPTTIIDATTELPTTGIDTTTVLPTTAIHTTNELPTTKIDKTTPFSTTKSETTTKTDTTINVISIRNDMNTELTTESDSVLTPERDTTVYVTTDGDAKTTNGVFGINKSTSFTDTTRSVEYFHINYHALHESHYSFRRFANCFNKSNILISCVLCVWRMLRSVHVKNNLQHLLKNICLLGVVVGGPLQGKHCTTLSIVPTFPYGNQNLCPS
jgi:hypothetical protein